MKKNFVKVLAALLVTATFSVFASCQNNADSSSGSSTTIDQTLVGTWNLTTDKATVTPSDVGNVIPQTITFASNGNVSGEIFISADGTAWTSSTMPFTGTSTTASGKVKITPHGRSSLEYTYTISGTEATFTIRSLNLKYNKQ